MSMWNLVSTLLYGKPAAPASERRSSPAPPAVPRCDCGRCEGRVPLNAVAFVRSVQPAPAASLRELPRQPSRESLPRITASLGSTVRIEDTVAHVAALKADRGEAPRRALWTRCHAARAVVLGGDVTVTGSIDCVALCVRAAPHVARLFHFFCVARARAQLCGAGGQPRDRRLARGDHIRGPAREGMATAANAASPA
jgi:hypothetical protein